MAILAAAGIQSPDYAPTRSWQQIFGGWTAASHPARPHQHNLHYTQQGLWIPASARMTGWGSRILTAARITVDNEKALCQAGNCSDLGCRIARTLLDNRRPRRRQLNSIHQHLDIWPFDTRTSLILDCYSLEHWLPFFARTIRSPAETNKERISLDRTSDRPRMKKWRRKLVSTGWRRVPGRIFASLW